jgi:hypothetical protein
MNCMRYFAEHCPDGQLGQQPADQLPWFRVVTLLTKAGPGQRESHATQCDPPGWVMRRSAQAVEQP